MKDYPKRGTGGLKLLLGFFKTSAKMPQCPATLSVGVKELGQWLLPMSVAFVSANGHLLGFDFAILLFSDVFPDDFSVNSNGTHEVPPSPHVHTAIAFAKFGGLLP
jgi:hypothetical protein